jgi:hypothetical protein
MCVSEEYAPRLTRRPLTNDNVIEPLLSEILWGDGGLDAEGCCASGERCLDGEDREGEHL